MSDVRAALIRVCVLASAGLAASLGISLLAPSATESASANGDTRTLHLYHTHTGETIDATFRVDGHYDPAVLRQLNHFLRDWRNDDEHEMDPRLFDAVWEAYRTAGATDRVQIYSAYRSPQTNAMLRRRSRAVAEHSQHMLGKAMDTTMPGFPMSRIREAGMKLQRGGVGWYPSANFVHLDVGGVRSWPRMSYDQLASIFPDGKTVHIASDGRTLPGYDQARVEIAERGGTEVPPAQESSGFMAWLFGSGSSSGAGDEEERRAPVVVARAAPQAAPAPAAALAYAGEAEPAAAAAHVPADQASTEAQAPGRPQGDQQVARLETPDTTAEPEVVMPLPPRRPTDLAMAPAREIPLPPARPASLDRLQTASIRFSDAQPEARVPLPPIITRGTGVPGPARATLPRRALAFAPPDAAELRAVPPMTPPARSINSMALRSALQRSVVAVVTPAPAGLGAGGPRLTGLRRAAKLMSDDAAL